MGKSFRYSEQLNNVMNQEEETNNEVVLIYDGECPLCNQYCNLSCIKKSISKLRQVNARSDAGLVAHEISAAGLDIDQGVVLKLKR